VIAYPSTTLLRSALAVGFCLLAVKAAAQIGDAEQLLPLSSFFSEPPRFAERLSPDGTRVAFLGPDHRSVIRLWMAEVEQPENIHRVSAKEGGAVMFFFWIGDHSLLWQEKTSTGQASLHLHDLKSGATRQILAEENRFIRLEGVVDSEDPCILICLSDKPAAFPDLYRVKLSGVEPPELIYTNDHHILTWAWDRAGMPVSGIRWTETGAKELLSFREHPVRVIFRVDPTDDLRLLMASADGTQALVITDHDSDLTHLEWIHLTTGARQRLGKDPMGRVDIGEAWTHNGELLAVAYSDRTMRWHAIAPGVSSVLASIPDDPSGPQNLSILGMDKSQKRLLFKRFSGQDPGTLYLKNIEDETARMLWKERPEIDPSTMCESRAIEYPARDGCRIPAYLTLPKNSIKPLPLVVFPHGGPRMRTHSGFDGRVQFLASRGYAVLQPNFRGSRGYGKAFMNAGDGQWGKGVMQTDVTDGLDYLIREEVADPRRIAILGGSYGGYAALAGLAFTPDRYAAGICLFGISDLVEYATHHPVEWQAYAGDTIRRLDDPASEAGRKRLEDRSPVRHATVFKAPLLIHHGALDPLIPVDHAKKMVSVLKGADKKVDFLLAQDEAHGFSNPESEMAVYRAIELFLHEHLGGKVGPGPSESVAARLALFRQSGSRKGSHKIPAYLGEIPLPAANKE